MFPNRLGQAGGAVLLVAVTVLGTLPCDVLVSAWTARAEGKPPFMRLAELAVQKGYKNVSFEAACHHFQLAGRAEDGACLGNQLSSRIDDADAKKYGIALGTGMSLGIFVEKGTGVLRLMIGERDDQAAYVFLTNQQGQLLRAMMGPKVVGDYRWHLIEITEDVRGRFAREVAYWIGSAPEIEQLPDQK